MATPYLHTHLVSTKNNEFYDIYIKPCREGELIYFSNYAYNSRKSPEDGCELYVVSGTINRTILIKESTSYKPQINHKGWFSSEKHAFIKINELIRYKLNRGRGWKDMGIPEEIKIARQKYLQKVKLKRESKIKRATRWRRIL